MYPGSARAQRAHVGGAQVGLDEHPPHRRWRAERAYPLLAERSQQQVRGEPLVAEDQRGRLRVPWGEHVAPGVLRPAGRGDVQVDVPRLQPDPVHRGQVAHRVGHLGVLHQLGLGRGARGEVEQQRVAGPGRPVRGELGAGLIRIGIAMPAGGSGRGANDDAGPVPAEPVKLRPELLLGHHVPDVAPVDAVGEVVRAEQGTGRDDHHAELDRGEDDLPQFGDVAQHEQQPVAAPGAEGAQPVGHLVRPGRQLAVGQRGRAALGDHPQRLLAGVLGRDHVEPVQRPVELVKLRPGELADGRVVVLAVAQQQVSGGAEGGRRWRRLRHGLHRIPRHVTPACA